MLKSQAMNPEPRGLSNALLRAWRAVAKAFTPTADASRFRGDGADTTLFGAMAEPTAGAREPPRTSESWDPLGESTDFADPEEPGRSPRRR
ncbi:MAG: hypothetical protein NVS3B2_00100 [Ramlibacter sp.]